MQFILARERFSKHAKSLSCSAQVLHAAVSRYGRSPQNCRFQRLSGGFMNANYLVSGDDERFVLRVYSTDVITADRECDLLRALASTPVLAPRALANFQVENRPVAILEFIDGITLEDLLLSGEPIPADLYSEIGRQLAEIHRITFPTAGFIGPQLTIGGEYEEFAAFLAEQGMLEAPSI